jgi:hypothetical protein
MGRGIAMDNGTIVDPSTIPIPDLCGSCRRWDTQDPSCDLTRLDQAEETLKGEMFCCFAYEPVDPKADKDKIFEQMESYLASKR